MKKEEERFRDRVRRVVAGSGCWCGHYAPAIYRYYS